MNNVLEWKPNGKYHFEELGLYDSIILKWILDKEWEAVDWTHLTQDRNNGGLL